MDFMEPHIQDGENPQRMKAAASYLSLFDTGKDDPSELKETILGGVERFPLVFPR